MRASSFYHIVQLLVRKSGHTEHIKFDFKLSIYTVRLIFFQAHFYRHFTQAFKHLEIFENQKPDLTIFILDHETSIVPLKLPTHRPLLLETRGEIPSLSDDHLFTSYNHHDGSLNIIHLTDNIGIYWVRGQKYVPWWTSASPLQRIISYWFRHQNHELTHAACVGNDQDCVLFAGASGAGKSTTTLACLSAGLRYLSEDYCLIQNNPNPIVHNVYNTLKLDNKTLNFFPEYKPWISNPGKKPHEKAFIFPSETFPYQYEKTRSLKAIFVLKQVSQQKSMVVRCNRAEALSALSVSTIFQLAGTGQTTLNFYVKLLDKVPSYRLCLGTDLNQVGSCVMTFLRNGTA